MPQSGAEITSPLLDAMWYCSLREMQRTFVVATTAIVSNVHEDKSRIPRFVRIQNDLVAKPYRPRMRFHIDPLVDRMHTKTRALSYRTRAVDVPRRIPVMDHVGVTEYDVANGTTVLPLATLRSRKWSGSCC